MITMVVIDKKFFDSLDKLENILRIKKSSINEKHIILVETCLDAVNLLKNRLRGKFFDAKDIVWLISTLGYSLALFAMIPNVVDISEDEGEILGTVMGTIYNIIRAIANMIEEARGAEYASKIN